MRDLADAALVRRFMKELGRAAKKPASVYLTGGACAVLLGWRHSTIDLDLKLVSQDDELLKPIPRLKEELRINVELAAPDQFIPPLPGWTDRCVFIAAEGKVSYFHYDFYAQALAKIERGHRMDQADVASMLETGVVKRAKLRELYAAIEPELYRYPAVDPKAFGAAVQAALKT